MTIEKLRSIMNDVIEVTFEWTPDQSTDLILDCFILCTENDYRLLIDYNGGVGKITIMKG